MSKAIDTARPHNEIAVSAILILLLLFEVIIIITTMMLEIVNKNKNAFLLVAYK